MPDRKKISKASAPTTKKTKRKISLPPGPDASCEQIDSYFAEHSLEDLEKAGQARALTEEETDWVGKLASVAKERILDRKGRSGQLNLAMPADQLDRFNRYAKKKHIPPSTLARAWILERLDQESKDAS